MPDNGRSYVSGQRRAHRHAFPFPPLKTRLSPRDLALTLAVVAVWGYTFVPIKVALDGSRRRSRSRRCASFWPRVPMVFFVRPPAMPWRHVVAYGFAIGVCQFGLLFLGIKLGMPAGLSSLVIQVQVFFTIGLAVAFAGDRLRRHNLVGAAIAVAGMIVLALLQGGERAHRNARSASRSSSRAAFAWAVGNIIAKRGPATHGADMFALTVWSSLVPPLPLARAGRSRSRAAPPVFGTVASMSLVAWACVLVMSYGATLFGFGSWNALLHRYPTALISPFALLIPVSGLASGALFLGESLAPAQIAGVALVFAGLVVNVYGLRLRAFAARALGQRH